MTRSRNLTIGLILSAVLADQTTKEWAAGEATRKAATTTKKAVSTAKKKVARKVSGSLKKT